MANKIYKTYTTCWKRIFFWKHFSRKQRLYFNFALGAFLVVAIPVVVAILRSPNSAQAAWLDDTWAYRKSIPVTSTNGSAQTNVYISFTLDTATLITNGQLQSSCQDIRITDVNGNLLKYHVGRTNACNNAATTIDFLPSPNFPDGTSTYYVYYGNPRTSSQDLGAFTQSQASNYTIGILGSEEKSTGPVGYWSLDEGYGSTAHNNGSGGTALNGTLNNFSSPTVTTSGSLAPASTPNNGYSMTITGTDSNGNASTTGTNTESVTLTFSTGGGTTPTIMKVTNDLAPSDDCSNLGLGSWPSSWSYYSSSTSWTMASDNSTNARRVCAQFDTGTPRSPGATPLTTSPYVSGTICFASDTSICVTNPSGWTQSGKINKALLFDGSNDYISMPSDAAPLKITGALTLSAWINLTDTSSTHDIISKWTGTASTSSYDMFIDSSGKLNMKISDGTTITTTTGATTLSSSTWYFVTAVYNPSSSVTLYVNGVQDKQNTTSIPSSLNNSTTILDIGAENAGTNPFKGTIDEPKVYNYAKTTSEAQSGYNARGVGRGTAVNLGNITTSGNAPVAHWDFEEGSGSSLNDSTGNANIGTWNGTLGNQWTIGKFGKGGKFNGSDNYISFGTTISTINSIGFWVYPNSTSQYFMDFDGGTHYISASSGTVSATGFTSPTIYVNGVSGGTITANTWNHIEVTTATSFASTTSMTFGKSSTNYLNGRLDDIRMYDYARSQQQVIQDMNAGHPPPGSPVGSAVGYWKFDEGYGTTANNSGNGGSALNGTLTNMASPATSTSGWTQSGKFGKALNLDGTNDYIAMPSDVSALKITGDVTLSAWIKLSDISTQHDIICKYTGTASTSAYCLYVDTNGKLNMAVVNSTGPAIVTTTGTQTLSSGTWYYVAGVFSSASSVTLYVNGLQDKQNTTSIPTTLQNPSTIMDIGAENAGSNLFKGTIDEPKVYVSALAASQIQEDMNQGKAQVLGALSDNSSYQPNAANQEYCIPGDSTSCAAPVGRWDFEEGSGTSVQDSSGNVVTGTLSTPTYTPGKIGKALKFNGSSDSVTFATTISGVKTVSFWVNPATTTQYFMDLDGGTHYISASSGTVSATGFTSPTIYVNGVSGGTIAANAWNHIEVTTGTSFNTTASMTFGKSGSNYLNGKLDAVRVFNYARSAAQIEWDYDRGAPVGWWKFDECQGSTAHDSSVNGNGLANGNNGTITIGASGTQTAVGTCTDGNSAHAWYNGATGKYNYSLNFDGTDDYVSIPGTSNLNLSQYTVAFWMNADNPSDTGAIEQTTSKATSGNNSNWQFSWRHTNSTFQKACAHSVSGGYPSASKITSTMNAGTWYHVVCTYDGTNLKAYLNGNLEATTAIGSPDTGLLPLGIGSGYNSVGSVSEFKGKVDDYRVYNYALTATQIKTLYNQGGAVRYGPSTGSP